jgi:hypothetical protein
MAIANRFYRTEDPKLAAKLAQEYQQSLRPYDQADISQYRMPELLMPAGSIAEKWSNKYKRSIDCNNPKGFSQRAHCQGREKTESLDQDVVENFADGKKTGRKGLAKRMGVDCSQPVGKLRKIAANSSGERQRMAHWCANMKAGKNESVNEGADDNIDTIIQSFVASPTGQKYKQHDCKTVTRAFVRWAEQNKIPTQVVVLAPPSADFIAKNPRYKGKSGEGDGHIMPIVNGNAIDFTVRQFGVSRPFENPLVTPVVSLPSVYGKFGYFTHKPEWFLRGKSYWIGALNSIPNEIFNQNFGEEMLEYIIA